MTTTAFAGLGVARRFLAIVEAGNRVAARRLATMTAAVNPAFDKEQFESTVRICAVRVAKTETQSAVKKLRQFLFRGRRIAPVVDDPASGEHK